MLSSENNLQQALNEAGRLCTGELLDRFETPGRAPIVIRGRKLTYKHSVGMLVEDHENDAYDIPPLDAPVATVAIGLDGTCMLLCEDGWREAMCGIISLYDGNGHRQYTIYTAAAPEYGKATFLARLTQEIAAVKQRYPFASYTGCVQNIGEAALVLLRDALEA